MKICVEISVIYGQNEAVLIPNENLSWNYSIIYGQNEAVLIPNENMCFELLSIASPPNKTALN